VTPYPHVTPSRADSFGAEHLLKRLSSFIDGVWMNYFRLLKPLWGKKNLRKQKGQNVEWIPNKDLVREIEGPDTIEGYFDAEYISKKNADGYNVYYFPNGPSRVPEGKKFISGKDIDTWNFVFVDMDLKDKVYETKEAFLAEVEKFAVPPTKVVSSGNGIHVYWRVTDLDRETYMLLQMMLIQHFRTDESVWTPLQLMRWPESLNTKDPENFKQVEVLPNLSTGAAYHVGDLWPCLPDITTDNKHRIQLHIAKLMGIHTVDVGKTDVLIDELPPRFEDLMEQDEYVRELFEKPKETYGDRSAADMALTNILFSYDLSREEALQVMYNCEKARERTGQHRTSYAANLVDKVYGDRSEHAALSVKEIRERGDVTDLGELVNGPDYMDCLGFRWRKKQIFGLIAPPGGGKTSKTLKMFKEFIERNPHNDDIFLFFSLEMPAGQILERWDKLTAGNPAAQERLHIATNWTPDGKRRYINLQDIVEIAKHTTHRTGKKVGAIAIDHLGMLNTTIDTRRSPNFGFSEASSMSRYKRTISLDVKQLCLSLAEVAQTIDCFLIIQSQTTKEKAGSGDKPLEMNAAYGAAAFEWICDYVVTCWQPLLRVYDRTPLRVLAWRYAKIREIRPDDPIQRGQACLVHYDGHNGDMRRLTGDEYAEAQNWLAEIEIMLKEASKKGGQMQVSYANSPDFKKMQMILGAKQA
jgi:hypothetical protein